MKLKREPAMGRGGPRLSAFFWNNAGSGTRCST
jgi:hypothetical protein